jgi:hypothetical protein
MLPQENDNEKNANELLANWSKWLITINVFAATGCVVALKDAGAAAEKTGAFFFGAILSFGCSVICSTLFVFLMARQGLKQNTTTKQFLWLAKLQWVLFTAGILFVLIWIAMLSKLV